VRYQRAQLPLTSGSHHVRDTNARGLRAVGLAAGGLADSRRQRLAQGKFKPDDGGESGTNHDDPDSHEVSCRRVCFHGSSVVLHRLKVLIERIYWFIDANDGGPTTAASRLLGSARSHRAAFDAGGMQYEGPKRHPKRHARTNAEALVEATGLGRGHPSRCQLPAHTGDEVSDLRQSRRLVKCEPLKAD
jgi:hypothetical protein